jgi:hypothetical protein
MMVGRSGQAKMWVEERNPRTCLFRPIYLFRPIDECSGTSERYNEGIQSQKRESAKTEERRWSALTMTSGWWKRRKRVGMNGIGVEEESERWKERREREEANGSVLQCFDAASRVLRQRNSDALQVGMVAVNSQWQTRRPQ